MVFLTLNPLLTLDCLIYGIPSAPPRHPRWPPRTSRGFPARAAEAFILADILLRQLVKADQAVVPTIGVVLCGDVGMWQIPHENTVSRTLPFVIILISHLRSRHESVDAGTMF